jgi:hypothetical protein
VCIVEPETEQVLAPTSGEFAGKAGLGGPKKTKAKKKKDKDSDSD